MARTAVVYSGISYQHQAMNLELFRGRFDVIDIYDLPKTDLSAYDALIMPRSTDQVALASCRRQIAEFLDLPGIVVALGDYWGDWLPGCTYGGFTPEDDMQLEKMLDHRILEGVESNDLHWHKGINGLCSHGHLVAPPMAKVMVCNSRGDAILYEDRISTRGIIVAGSQFDVFCHTFSRDEGAMRALDNILNWIEEEAPALREQRNRRPIGVVYSGLHFHHDLFTKPEYVDDFELVHTRVIETTDLLKYNVLVVPRESNQEVLHRIKPRIRQFLDQGRTLVSFGEMTVPWLPNCRWENRRPKICFRSDDPGSWGKGEVQTEPLCIEDPDHSLFQGITLDDMKWHFHGIYWPQKGQRTLLSDGNGGAVIMVDEVNFAGRMLITTLEPEEHAGFGEVTVTLRFLARCIDWIRQESNRIEGTPSPTGQPAGELMLVNG